MKNLKKVVALVLAMIMVCGSVAIAKDYPDVKKDHANYNAISTLSQLGVLQGDQNGNFKPEATLTRAEATKMLDILISDADNSTKVKTNFKDVTAKHWGSGYINSLATNFIVNGEAVINGMTKTTFAPDATLEYAQFVKMLVVALGYAPNAEKDYPAGYLSAARSIKLTNGATGSATEKISRAKASQLLVNALDIKTMVKTGSLLGQPTYAASDVTFVDTYRGLSRADGVLDYDTDLKVFVVKSKALSGPFFGPFKDYEGARDADLLNVTVYYTGNVVKSLVVNGKSEVKATIALPNNDLTAVDPTSTPDALGKITYKVGTKSTSLNVAANAKFTENGVNKNSLALLAFVNGIKTQKGTLDIIVGSEGTVIGLKAVMYTDGIVTNVNNTVNTKNIVLGSNTIDVKPTETKTVSITKAGKEITLADVKKNDYIAVETDDVSYVKVEVIESTVVGAITSTSKVGTTLKATIGGISYVVVDNTFITDLIPRNSGTAYLNKAGEIVRFVKDATTSTKNYAYMKSFNYATQSVVVIKADGTEATMKIADKVNYKGTENQVPSYGFNDKDFALNSKKVLAENETKLIEYSLDAAGSINVISDVNVTAVTGTTITFDDTRNAIKATTGAASKYYLLADKMAVLNVTGALVTATAGDVNAGRIDPTTGITTVANSGKVVDASKVKIVSNEFFKKNSSYTGVNVVLNTAGLVEYAIVGATDAVTVDAKSLAVVKDAVVSNSYDGFYTYHTTTVLVDGAEKVITEKVAANGSPVVLTPMNGLKIGNVITVTYGADDMVTGISTVGTFVATGYTGTSSGNIVVGAVTAMTGSKVTIGTADYFINANTKVYNVNIASNNAITSIDIGGHIVTATTGGLNAVVRLDDANFIAEIINIVK